MGYGVARSTADIAFDSVVIHFQYVKRGWRGGGGRRGGKGRDNQCGEQGRWTTFMMLLCFGEASEGGKTM